MEFSTWFVIVVFALGAAVGGLFVALQRQCEMERIKHHFEQQLEELMPAPVPREPRLYAAERGKRSVEDRNRPGTEPALEVQEQTVPEQAAQDDGWEQLFIPPPEVPGRSHTGI